MKVFGTCFVLAALLCSAAATSDQEPLELAESITADFKYGGGVAAFSSASRPYVLLVEGGGVYWVLDVEATKTRTITEDGAAGTGSLVSTVQWANDEILLFYSSSETVKLVNPENPDESETLPAEIRSAPLRRALWVDELEVLIDEVDTYVKRNGKLEAVEATRSYHVPYQSGLVVMNDRYITSGYEDQILRLWSLPEGEMLDEWKLGRWYSSRKINDIAVAHGRLLVASYGGHIEERSLETGEALWAARPCRGGAAQFFYSSQYQNFGSSFYQPVGSINVEDRIYYACGNRVGSIQWASGGWQHESLTQALELENPVVNIEVIPGTDLAVLMLSEGEVLVLDRKQKSIVQTLNNTTKDNPGAVTYIAATQQLLVMGEEDAMYLYNLLVEPESSARDASL